MEIIFGLDLDGPVWLGHLPTGHAVAGAAAVGPAGLSRLLALHLGLAPPTSMASRTAALVGPMLSQAGFWSASASADPIGTASALLRWRDDLLWAGWRGEIAGTRLDTLFTLTGCAPPGPADVALQAIGVVGSRRLGWSVTSVDANLAGLIARVLEALHATQRAPLPNNWPRADEVLVVEPESLVDAAEFSAAWLSTKGSRVVVGREPLLDGALARIGLPTLGQGHGAEGDPALAVLPAVVALSFDVDDPRLAQRLLRLPQTPIHSQYRARLLAALSEWPSTISPSWSDAIVRSDEQLAEPGRTTARQALNDIFDARFHVDARITLVERWANERAASPVSSPSWLRVVDQCRQVRRLLVSVGSHLGPLDVLRLVDVVTADVGSRPLHPAEAGIFHVAQPGCVLADVNDLLWWAVPDAAREMPRLTRQERAALRAHGVVLPDATHLSQRQVAAWARALGAPTRGLLVVAPKVDAQGNPVPRPTVVDEVLPRADVARSKALWKTERGEQAAVRDLVQPRTEWRVPAGRVRLRDVESPNSVASMLGCSFRWALRYSTSVSQAADGTLPGGPLLFGRLAHDLLHAVLEQHPDAGAAQLADELGRRFDAEGPRLAATLFLPGVDAERAAVRAVVVDAGRLVGHLMADLGVRVEHAEQPFADDGAWLGARFQGRPDLVLGPSPRLVIDFKWSLGRHRDAMRAGAAHQLASYSFLVGGGAGNVDVGYLVLRLRQIFSTTKLSTRGARHIEGPAPAMTFVALQRSAVLASTRLLDGSLIAPGADGRDIGADRIDGDGLAIAPPCTFCEYGVLCGRNTGRTR